MEGIFLNNLSNLYFWRLIFIISGLFFLLLTGSRRRSSETESFKMRKFTDLLNCPELFWQKICRLRKDFESMIIWNKVFEGKYVHRRGKIQIFSNFFCRCYLNCKLNLNNKMALITAVFGGSKRFGFLAYTMLTPPFAAFISQKLTYFIKNRFLGKKITI